jgi:hypothetical protein
MRAFLPILLSALLSTPFSHAQWQIQESHSTASFRGIHALGMGVAWASGTQGTVLRTVDGGKNWQACAVPPDAEKLDFRGIQAFDAQTAIVMSSGKGDLSRLYKTVDGCKTWKLVFSNPDKEGFWDAIKFIEQSGIPRDRDFGMLLGDPVAGVFAIFLTFDRGDHWERQLKEAPAAQAGESIFAASNSSLLVNSMRDRQFVTGGEKGSRHITFSVRSEDTSFERDAKVLPGAKEFYGPGQRLWEVSQTSLKSNPTAGAFSIAARPWGPSQPGILSIVIVGGDYRHPDAIEGTAAYGSFRSMAPAGTPPHGYRSSVAYDEVSKSWITVGPNGTDVSSDDGKNWRALRPTSKDGGVADADRDWNALSLPFVVGPKGRIGRLRVGALKP